MKLNVKVYKTLNNPVEVQQIDGKEVEIHYMNDTPYLSRYAGRGNFVIWTSDGQGYKLLVERDYYNALKPLHSAETNALWLDFYEGVHKVRRNLFLKIMLPMLILILGVMTLFALVPSLQKYQTTVLIVALILMLVFNMFQSNLLKRKIDEIRVSTIDTIRDVLGLEHFNELVEKQNSFYENYFKFEEHKGPESEELEQAVENPEIKQFEVIEDNGNEITSLEEVEVIEKKVDYNSLLVKDLKELAKARNITDYSSMKKAELVAALEETEE